MPGPAKPKRGHTHEEIVRRVAAYLKGPGPFRKPQESSIGADFSAGIAGGDHIKVCQQGHQLAVGPSSMKFRQIAKRAGFDPMKTRLATIRSGHKIHGEKGTELQVFVSQEVRDDRGGPHEPISEHAHEKLLNAAEQASVHAGFAPLVRKDTYSRKGVPKDWHKI
jgi:hypothetical protein